MAVTFMALVHMMMMFIAIMPMLGADVHAYHNKSPMSLVIKHRHWHGVQKPLWCNYIHVYR